VHFDHFCFGVFVRGVLMFDMLVFAVFVLSVFRMFVHDVLGVTQSGGVFGAFVRGVGFEFGTICGAMFLNFLGFFLGEFGFRGGLIFGGVKVRFFLAVFFFGFFVFGEFSFAGSVNFLSVVLFEICAPGQSVGLGVVGGFLVFCFGQFKSEGGRLPLTQFSFAASGFGVCTRLYRQFERRGFMPRRIRAVSEKGRIRSNADIFVSGDGSGFGFRAGVGEKPAGKSSGEAARDCSAGRSGGRNGSDAQVAGRAGSCFLEIRLRLVNFRLGHWRRRRSGGLATILCERLAGEKNGFFRDRAGC
jgi:hypothetical protein